MSTARAPTPPALARNGGFTLLEVLVAVAIVGVLVGLAIPSMSALVAKQRLRGASNDLFSSLIAARSEALKRNLPVTVSSVNGTQWQGGWSTANPTVNATDMLDQHAAIANATITGPASVTFNTNGRLTNGATPTFDVSVQGTTSLRCLKIDLSGRPFITQSAC
ncbi:MAG: GspH/FimT family pseudopilin [Pseudomonadota bacterium]